MKEFFETYKAEILAIFDEIIKFVKKLIGKELEGEDFADIIND